MQIPFKGSANSEHSYLLMKNISCQNINIKNISLLAQAIHLPLVEPRVHPNTLNINFLIYLYNNFHTLFSVLMSQNLHKYNS